MSGTKRDPTLSHPVSLRTKGIRIDLRPLCRKGSGLSYIRRDLGLLSCAVHTGNTQFYRTKSRPRGFLGYLSRD